MHNNAAERVLRAVALGERIISSQAPTQATNELRRNLIGTAKLDDLDPVAYLREVDWQRRVMGAGLSLCVRTRVTGLWK